MKKEFPDPPVEALFNGAQSDNEHAALRLLLWHGNGFWLRRREVAEFVTVTVHGRYPDCETCWAVIDWTKIAQALDEGNMGNVGDDSYVAILAVACSLASGHPIDLRRVGRSLGRSKDAAAVAYALLRSGGHDDHVVRWPETPSLPNYVRIVDTQGRVRQAAGVRHEDQWCEIGPLWLTSTGAAVTQ